ncbi:hypothetical protein IQ251_01865 [Saccharopolyspora sp. HNM0983]|uniref:Uncharacterized protein n=1 Tax=Saccharopolyspora montiporae TaxID=2781240 RepID=A0A929B4T2_9PSEU|nr:hypothetical protein [Saccharopolyspora sp. HNM0983]MBE9373187.1 hypothetical protein [Saccharopolyspora sp. HNM0983]
MSWTDHYQRQAAIRTVLDDAHRDPASALTTVPTPFTDRAQLLRALHYKWSQVLTGHLEAAVADSASTEDGHVQAVTAAHQRAAATCPALRALLDHHRDDPALRECLQREQQLLALTAGLAEPDEPTPEITRVGSALQQLLRSGRPEPERPRTRPFGQLRKLIPSR